MDPEIIPGKGLLAVDFDSSITSDFTTVGPPFPGVKEALDLLAQYYTIVCWTSRLSEYITSQQLDPAAYKLAQVSFLQNYFIQYQLPISGVSGDKIPAVHYVDDHAIELGPDHDWEGVVKRLTPHQQILVLMTGLPGAAKSTYSKDKLKGFARVSVDSMKAMLGVEVDENDLWRIEREMVKILISAGHDVVVDRLNLTVETRMKYIALGRQLQSEVWVFKSDVSPEEAQMTNIIREEHKQLEPDELQSMIERYEEPDYSEGMDRIVYFRPLPEVVSFERENEQEPEPTTAE